MKSTCIILSVIFLILSCFTCTDTESNATHAGGDSLSANTTHTDDSDTKCDICSPFGVCSSCTGVVISFSTAVVVTPLFHTEIPFTQDTFYKTNFTSAFSGSIWQPPQIV